MVKLSVCQHLCPDAPVVAMIPVDDTAHAIVVRNQTVIINHESEFERRGRSALYGKPDGRFYVLLFYESTEEEGRYGCRRLVIGVIGVVVVIVVVRPSRIAQRGGLKCKRRDGRRGDREQPREGRVRHRERNEWLLSSTQRIK